MKLYLVPTPVGNLSDMTYRGVEVLKAVDLILAEDTRTSGVLLRHYEIATPMQSYHIFNEHQRVETIIEQLKGGSEIALITDAGTPGISDPGYLLVREAIREGIAVECLPGATAFVPALIDSGIPCDKFVFEGFLPHKKGRQSRLQELAREERTVILYESPFRIVKLLEQLQEVMGGEREISISREISKMHSETIRGTVASVMEDLKGREIKGEIVVILAGCQK